MSDGEAMERPMRYEPWVAYDMTELRYFKMRHLEQSKQIEQLELGVQLLQGALEDAIDLAGIELVGTSVGCMGAVLSDKHQRLAVWLRGMRDMVDAERSRVEFKQEYKGEWIENADAPKQVREPGSSWCASKQKYCNCDSNSQYWCQNFG